MCCYISLTEPDNFLLFFIDDSRDTLSTVAYKYKPRRSDEKRGALAKARRSN